MSFLKFMIASGGHSGGGSGFACCGVRAFRWMGGFDPFGSRSVQVEQFPPDLRGGQAIKVERGRRRDRAQGFHQPNQGVVQDVVHFVVAAHFREVAIQQTRLLFQPLVGMGDLLVACVLISLL
jgi:hypothetical protein